MRLLFPNKLFLICGLTMHMFLAANFVLPVSKEMPGSDEYFDQVTIFRPGISC